MRKIWLATDLHLFNRDNNARHPKRSPEMLKGLIEVFSNDMQENDLFIFLGDLCDPEVADWDYIRNLLDTIPCKKIMCKGNHDTEPDGIYRNLGFDIVCEILKLHDVIFSHFPLKVSPDEINIHGHVHGERFTDQEHHHINVYNSDWRYTPIDMDNLLRHIDDARKEFSNDKTKRTSVETLMPEDTHYYHEPYNIVDITNDYKGFLAPVDESAIMRKMKFNTPEELSEYMKKKIKYHHPYGDSWTLMKPEEVIRAGSGNCHDQAYLEYDMLSSMGLKPKMWFMICYRGDKIYDAGMTHTIVTYEKKGKLYWFENAWADEAGIHGPYNNIKAIEREIWDKYPNEKTEYPKFYFCRAVRVPYGSDLETYVDAQIPDELRYEEDDDYEMVEESQTIISRMLSSPDTDNELNEIMSSNDPDDFFECVEDATMNEVLFQNTMDTEYFESDDEEYEKKATKADHKAHSVSDIEESADKH